MADIIDTAGGPACGKHRRDCGATADNESPPCKIHEITEGNSPDFDLQPSSVTEFHTSSDDILAIKFSSDQLSLILRAFARAPIDDPILVISWNPHWLALPENALVRQQVVEFILAHKGSDPEQSGFIFHFQTCQDLLTCRDKMRAAIPAAFHVGAGVIADINMAHNTQIPAPVPMAEALIIFKTQVLATDYKADSSFFLRG